MSHLEVASAEDQDERLSRVVDGAPRPSGADRVKTLEDPADPVLHAVRRQHATGKGVARPADARAGALIRGEFLDPDPLRDAPRLTFLHPTRAVDPGPQRRAREMPRRTATFDAPANPP